VGIPLENIWDRSLFVEGEGNFFFPKFLKLKAPRLKEQKCNGDSDPCILEYISLTPSPFSFLLVKWGQDKSTRLFHISDHDLVATFTNQMDTRLIN
jgi:hypothetical protein